MIRVIETENGAQVLPPRKGEAIDERATISGWLAHCVMDADLRSKNEKFRKIAASLEIRK